MSPLLWLFICQLITTTASTDVVFFLSLTFLSLPIQPLSDALPTTFFNSHHILIIFSITKLIFIPHVILPAKCTLSTYLTHFSSAVSSTRDIQQQRISRLNSHAIMDIDHTNNTFLLCQIESSGSKHHPAVAVPLWAILRNDNHSILTFHSYSNWTILNFYNKRMLTPMALNLHCICDYIVNNKNANLMVKQCCFLLKCVLYQVRENRPKSKWLNWIHWIIISFGKIKLKKCSIFY